ncbi:unnamed protein product, partial [Dicrocoelium dendriticum]
HNDQRKQRRPSPLRTHFVVSPFSAFRSTAVPTSAIAGPLCVPALMARFFPPSQAPKSLGHSHKLFCLADPNHGCQFHLVLYGFGQNSNELASAAVLSRRHPTPEAQSPSVCSVSERTPPSQLKS